MNQFNVTHVLTCTNASSMHYNVMCMHMQCMYISCGSQMEHVTVSLSLAICEVMHSYYNMRTRMAGWHNINKADDGKCRLSKEKRSIRVKIAGNVSKL